MRSHLKVGATLLFCIAAYCRPVIAGSSNDPAFKERLSELGATYALPNGFSDKGPNVSLEKELGKEFDSKNPFVVHQINSIEKNMTAYLDVRVLGGINLKDPALAAGYPIVFEANAAAYCAMVSGDDCYVLNKFPREAVQADYNADFGMIFMAKKPNPKRIGGRKKCL